MQVGGSTTNPIRSARLHLNDACLRSKTKDKMFSVQTLIVATLLTQLVLVVAPDSKALQPARSAAAVQQSIADHFSRLAESLASNPAREVKVNISWILGLNTTIS
ncbi:unnamed protein product [Boreogadus saida]